MDSVAKRNENLNEKADLIISFPWSMPGFEEYKEFSLTSMEAGAPFYFLCSTQKPEIGLLLINPFTIFTSYEFDLSEEVASQLKITDEKQVAVLCTVNTSRGFSAATVNLLAPIVVNTKHLLAKQVILNDKRYALRTPLNPGAKKEER